MNIKNFIFNSEISNIAKQLMQSKKVNLFHEHVLVKEIGSKKRNSLASRPILLLC